MRSPGYTPLFMHENVPASISAPTRIRIGHPKKDLLHISNSRGILRTNAVSRVYCKLEIMSRDTNSELTFFDCCENDRIRDDSKIL